MLGNPSCLASSTWYHRCVKTCSSSSQLQPYYTDASQTCAKPARQRGGVAEDTKLSRNCSCLITMLAKLLTDYLKVWRKDKCQRGDFYIIWPLWKPHLVCLVSGESEHFKKWQIPQQMLEYCPITAPCRPQSNTVHTLISLTEGGHWSANQHSLLSWWLLWLAGIIVAAV